MPCFSRSFSRASFTFSTSASMSLYCACSPPDCTLRRVKCCAQKHNVVSRNTTFWCSATCPKIEIGIIYQLLGTQQLSRGLPTAVGHMHIPQVRILCRLHSLLRTTFQASRVYIASAAIAPHGCLLAGHTPTRQATQLDSEPEEGLEVQGQGLTIQQQIQQCPI